MISGGSCDTEDWSDDAENSALHHRNQLNFNIYIYIYINKKKTVFLNCYNSKYYWFYCIHDQIMNLRDFFQEHLKYKSYWSQTFER